MQTLHNNLAVLFALTLLSGCATITKDANQSVQIETYSRDNLPVSGASCIARNDRGEWTTTAPGAVSVHRSNQNLVINCKKDGEDPGHATVVSRVNGGMFGNIVFGGGIGAIIDHNKGTAYTYPSWLRVVMGESLVFDRKDEKENQPLTGKAPGAPELKEEATTTTAAAPAQP